MADLFTRNRIQYQETVESWEEAINLAAKPLVEEAVTSEVYVQSVIELCNEKGPYMNIGPEVVLAHARPMPDTKSAAVSLLITKDAIDFVEAGHKARIWLFLATPDAESHIELIQKLASILMNADKMQTILQARSVEAIWHVIND